MGTTGRGNHGKEGLWEPNQPQGCTMGRFQDQVGHLSLNFDQTGYFATFHLKVHILHIENILLLDLVKSICRSFECFLYQNNSIRIGNLNIW